MTVVGKMEMASNSRNHRGEKLLECWNKERLFLKEPRSCWRGTAAIRMVNDNIIIINRRNLLTFGNFPEELNVDAISLHPCSFDFRVTASLFLFSTMCLFSITNSLNFFFSSSEYVTRFDSAIIIYRREKKKRTTNAQLNGGKEGKMTNRDRQATKTKTTFSPSSLSSLQQWWTASGKTVGNDAETKNFSPFPYYNFPPTVTNCNLRLRLRTPSQDAVSRPRLEQKLIVYEYQFFNMCETLLKLKS